MNPTTNLAIRPEPGTEFDDLPLSNLDLVRVALAECKTAMEAKQIADVAEAGRVYLERINSSVEVVNRATEVRILAERQMGAFLKKMPKATGAMGIGTSAVVADDRTPTLKEIGITKDQSSRAQKLADIPEPEFRERIAVAKASGGKLTTAAIVGRGIPQKKSEYTIARTAWFTTKQRLDAIRDNDPEMPKVMREISRYALNRIKNKH